MDIKKGYIKTGFDIPNRDNYKSSDIKQWAWFIVHGIIHNLTTGDKFIDKYWGEITIVGFTFATCLKCPYGDMIEVVCPPCDEYDPQAIRYLYWDEFFERNIFKAL